MRYFSYNSKFFPEGTPIIGPDNRGLRYGDGLFETMKWINGSIVMADAHLDRLWTGMEKLAFQLPVLFSREFVLTQIHKLLAKNKDTTARIRLTVTRGDGGLYDPADHHPNLIIQTWPLAAATPLNENGLQLGIYTGALKVCDQFSNLKHNNYLCYLMGAIYAKNHQFNDAVMLNQHLRVCDSTIANLFIFKNNIVYTPSLAEGCVAGIMRQMLLSALPALGYEVKETEITREDLLDADEVFLSNSMYNIRWVSSIEQTVFKQQQVNQLVQRLRQTNGNVFC